MNCNNTMFYYILCNFVSKHLRNKIHRILLLISLKTLYVDGEAQWISDLGRVRNKLL